MVVSSGPPNKESLPGRVWMFAQQLKPGLVIEPRGIIHTLPLQHRHRARLPGTRPLPAVPCPHHSPGAGRNPSPNTLSGDTAVRGTGKT